MTDRWHNILGSIADWDRLSADFAEIHKKADEAGLRMTISDEACPCCGFRPTILINEAKEKKPRADVRQTKQSEQLPLGFKDKG